MQGQYHCMVLNARHPRHRDSHKPTPTAQARICRALTRGKGNEGKHEAELQVPQRMGSNRRVPTSGNVLHTPKQERAQNLYLIQRNSTDAQSRMLIQLRI